MRMRETGELLWSADQLVVEVLLCFATRSRPPYCEGETFRVDDEGAHYRVTFFRAAALSELPTRHVYYSAIRIAPDTTPGMVRTMVDLGLLDLRTRAASPRHGPPLRLP